MALLLASLYYLRHPRDDFARGCCFHLTNGFADADREELLNPRRYGARTRWDSAVFRCSVFSPKQVSAIVAYLNFKLEEEGERGYYAQVIREALANYWLGRT